MDWTLFRVERPCFANVSKLSLRETVKDLAAAPLVWLRLCIELQLSICFELCVQEEKNNAWLVALYISWGLKDEGCFVVLHSHKPVNDQDMQNVQNVQMPGHLTKSDNQSFWNAWIPIHHYQRIVDANMRWETEYVKLRRSDSLLCEVCDTQLNQVANVDTAHLERAVWFKLFCSLIQN